jgi:hypothetical protein
MPKLLAGHLASRVLGERLQRTTLVLCAAVAPLIAPLTTLADEPPARHDGPELVFMKDKATRWGLDRNVGASGLDVVTEPRRAGKVALRLGKGSKAVTGDLRMEQSTNIPTHALSHVRFWIHGGTAGGQRPTLVAEVRDPLTRVPKVLAPVSIASHLVDRNGTPVDAVPAGAWVEVRVPLAALGVERVGNFSGLRIPAPQRMETFYVADISLIGPAPAKTAAARVDFAQLRADPVPRTFYGVNLGYWDIYATWRPPEEGAAQVREAGINFVRYHPSNPNLNWHISAWDITVPMGPVQPGGYVRYLNLLEQVKGDGVVSLNYLLGSPEQAAAVVAYTNVPADAPQALLDMPIGEADEVGVDPAKQGAARFSKIRRDWKTVGFWVRLRGEAPIAGNPDGLNHLRAAHPAPWRVSYWELGNELWMLGTDPANDTRAVLGARAGSPQDIAAFAAAMSRAIKRVDPTVKLGVHIELTWSNAPSEVTYRIPGTDRTTTEHREAVFAAMAGVDPETGLRDPAHERFVPDFLVSHNYIGSSRDDFHVLQLSNNQDFLNWRVRERIIRDRLARWYGAGDPAVAAIELHDNENGLPPSDPDNQQVNLVAGLACADSMAIALQSEFRNLCWFALSAGPGGKNVNSNVYGWRTFGAYAMTVAYKEGSGVGPEPGQFDGARLPPYYAHQLLTQFARPGDRIVDAPAIACDNPLVSVYAARSAAGAASLLLINKAPTTAVNASVTIDGLGFEPIADAQVTTYGRSEDDEQRRRWEAGDHTNIEAKRTTCQASAQRVAIDLPAYSINVVTLQPTGR